MSAEPTSAIEDAVVEGLRALSPDRQQEVLDFVEYLQHKSTLRPRRSWKGIGAHLGVNLSQEDIAEARREMWANFPRMHFFDEPGEPEGSDE